MGKIVLLDVSLTSVGLRPPVTAALMAAGIERLCSLVALTPGGRVSGRKNPTSSLVSAKTAAIISSTTRGPRE